MFDLLLSSRRHLSYHISFAHLSSQLGLSPNIWVCELSDFIQVCTGAISSFCLIILSKGSVSINTTLELVFTRIRADGNFFFPFILLFCYCAVFWDMEYREIEFHLMRWCFPPTPPYRYQPRVTLGLIWLTKRGSLRPVLLIHFPLFSGHKLQLGSYLLSLLPTLSSSSWIAFTSPGYFYPGVVLQSIRTPGWILLI